MLIDAKGKYGKHLKLGIQSNPNNVNNTALWLAKQWAPKTCKSLTISKLSHKDYHGNCSDKVTGFADIEVQYYSTLKEGKILLSSIPNEHPSDICLSTDIT